MLVAITQRQDKNKHGDLMDNLELNYINYLMKFDIQPIIIPNISEKVESFFELPIEGIILTGGNGVNPELYGKKAEEDSDISKKRDETEKKLLEIAIKKKLPVLGICRGMQFMNVFFGGKLVRISDEVKGAVCHVATTHKIKIIDENFLGRETEVNSYHNYGVIEENLGKDLNIFAKSTDDVIEGVYHKDLPIAAIEWHPERTSPDENINEKIIKAFINKELFWS